MSDGFYTNDEEYGSFGGYGSDGADDDAGGFSGGFSAAESPMFGANAPSDGFGVCGAKKTARSRFFSLFRSGEYDRAA